MAATEAMAFSADDGYGLCGGTQDLHGAESCVIAIEV
jgi:hypothetical protein